MTGCGDRAASSSTDLTITVTAAEDLAPDRWTLYCDPAGGDHPDAQAACAYLKAARDSGADPFAPVPADQLCTQEYGGPATASVSGTWAGEPVDAAFSLTDGCQIARWDSARALLGPRPSAG